MDEDIKPEGPKNTEESEGTLSADEVKKITGRLVERGFFAIVVFCLGLMLVASYINNKSEMAELITAHEERISNMAAEKWSTLGELDTLVAKLSHNNEVLKRKLVAMEHKLIDKKGNNDSTNLSFYLYVGKDSPAINKIFSEAGHLKVFQPAPDTDAGAEKNQDTIKSP